MATIGELNAYCDEMIEKRNLRLMSMNVSEQVIRATMAANKCDELEARLFLESNQTAWRIAEMMSEQHNKKIAEILEGNKDNLQMAEKIVDIVRNDVTGRYSDIDYKNNYFDEIRDCCMLMAEWKDEQNRR